jgi:hypothetical protein
MKSLKIAILCLGVLTLAFGSQQAAAESGDGNAIPYPNWRNGKGSRGKPWRTRNPILSASPKRLMVPQCTGHHAG